MGDELRRQILCLGGEQGRPGEARGARGRQRLLTDEEQGRRPFRFRRWKLGGDVQGLEGPSAGGDEHIDRAARPRRCDRRDARDGRERPRIAVGGKLVCARHGLLRRTGEEDLHVLAHEKTGRRLGEKPTRGVFAESDRLGGRSTDLGRERFEPSGRRMIARSRILSPSSQA